VADMNDRLKSVGSGDVIVIDHFGLDMTFAWEQMRRSFQRISAVANIQYRAVMITDDESSIPRANAELKRWMASSGDIQPVIVDGCEQLKRIYVANRRTFDYQIKKYSDVPVLHGIRITSPEQVCYMAFCRWSKEDSAEFEWGGSQYQKIIGPHPDPSKQDFLEIFSAYFMHAWDQGIDIHRPKIHAQ
jgi:hypothetical protein